VSTTSSVRTIRISSTRKHAFTPTASGGYGECATCVFIPLNGVHKTVIDGDPVVIIRDPAVADQFLAVDPSDVARRQHNDEAMVQFLRDAVMAAK
jgi:hypothetical protein